MAEQLKALYDKRHYDQIAGIFQEVDLYCKDEQYWGVKPSSSRWCALMIFARAVLEELDEDCLNLRRMLFKTRTALYLCRNRMGNDLQWCLMNAQVYDALDLREDAWGWYKYCFNLAQKRGIPKDKALQIFYEQSWEIDRCSRFRSNPCFDYPFVDRVKRSWKAFELD